MSPLLKRNANPVRLSCTVITSMKLILTWYDKAEAALEQHVHLDKLIDMPVREEIGRMKYIPEKERVEKFGAIAKNLDAAFAALTEGGELDA